MSFTGPRSVRVVGRGRAGSSFAAALARRGWTVAHVAGRGEPSERIDGDDVALVLLCVTDDAIGEVAARVDGSAVVAHTSGASGLDVLQACSRRAAVHPLVSMPDAELGALRLLGGATFAIAGDPIVSGLVDDLGGTAVTLADAERNAYHAAATIASNDLVALLDQAARVAAPTGIGLSAYLDLVRGTVENVAALGTSAAITGPSARGDVATVERHRSLLDGGDLAAYDALALLCRRLAERSER